MDNNFKIFHSDNWGKASWQEKLEVLQKLENLQAVQQSRKPYVIELKQYESNRVKGEYCDGKEFIYLNENLLKNNDNFSNYTSIEAVFHERRHGYQYMVYERKIEHSNEKEVADWIKNKIFYINYSADKLLHKLQPREMDARKYGLAELEKFYNELEKSLGKDENAINYLNKRKEQEQEVIELAIKQYGRDYLLESQKDIDKLHYESKLDKAEKAYEEKYLMPLKDDLNDELKKINQEQQSIHANIMQQKKTAQEEIELARQQLDGLKIKENEVYNELYQLSQALHNPEAQKEIEKMAQDLLKQDQELYKQKLETKVDITNDINKVDEAIKNFTQEFIQQEESKTRQLTAEEAKELANEVYWSSDNDKEVSKPQEQFIKSEIEIDKIKEYEKLETVPAERLKGQLKDLESQIKKYDFEKEDLAKHICTERQADLVAKSMYTKGETTKLMKERSELNKEEKALNEVIKQHQENKPKMLDFKANVEYEKETKRLEELKKDFDQRNKQNLNDVNRVREQLQKPEAREKVEQLKGSILQKSASNQDKVSQLEQKLNGLRGERAEVIKNQIHRGIEKSMQQQQQQINKGLDR